MKRARHRRAPLAPVASHQPRSARDVAYALERGGVVEGPSRVKEGARAAERAPGVRGGSTNVEVADLLNRLPNAGLEHPRDSVRRRSLVLFHFYAAPRFLPFVLDGQRQAV